MSGLPPNKENLLIEAVQVVLVHQPDEFACITRVSGVAGVLNRLRECSRVRGNCQRGSVATVAEEEPAVIINGLLERQVRAEGRLNDDVAVRRVLPGCESDHTVWSRRVERFDAKQVVALPRQPAAAPV